MMSPWPTWAAFMKIPAPTALTASTMTQLSLNKSAPTSRGHKTTSSSPTIYTTGHRQLSPASPIFTFVLFWNYWTQATSACVPTIFTFGSFWNLWNYSWALFQRGIANQTKCLGSAQINFLPFLLNILKHQSPPTPSSHLNILPLSTWAAPAVQRKLIISSLTKQTIMGC